MCPKVLLSMHGFFFFKYAEETLLELKPCVAIVGRVTNFVVWLPSVMRKSLWQYRLSILKESADFLQKNEVIFLEFGR